MKLKHVFYIVTFLAFILAYGIPGTLDFKIVAFVFGFIFHGILGTAIFYFSKFIKWRFIDNKINDRQDFISKFLRGEYSLPFSFWGFGFSVSGFLLLAGFWSSSFLDSVFFDVILYVFELISKCCLVIGIWNAGKNYIGPKIWISASRVISIVLFSGSVIYYLSVLGNYVFK